MVEGVGGNGLTMGKKQMVVMETEEMKAEEGKWS